MYDNIQAKEPVDTMTLTFAKFDLLHTCMRAKSGANWVNDLGGVGEQTECRETSIARIYMI